VNAEPEFGRDEEGHEAERRASSMKDKLSKEVASWSKERKQQSSETVVGPLRPVVEQRSPRRAGERKKSSAPPPLAAKAVSARSKPFSMSYNGMTQAEYNQYLRDRGSR
jgi:hypothetical protein